MMTTPKCAQQNKNVEAAISDLKSDFQPKEFVVEPDGQGGAFVRFGPVTLSKTYAQTESWIGGQIPAQIPYADIYPIFFRGDLTRADGKALVAPMTTGHNYMGQSAVQVSRRANRRDASIETAKMKFKKVLEWVNEQP
jgi:hypothetical protein